MELKLSMIFLLIGTIISLSHLNRENLIRACLQLGGLCMRTDQNQTRNIVLFAAPPVRRGFPNQLSSD
jgi:hypothetical protein